MKRHLFFIMAVLVPVINFSQVTDSKKSLETFARKDSLIQSLAFNGDFLDIGGKTFSDKASADFRKLFTSKAKVFDGLNPVRDKKDRIIYFSYSIPKSIDQYVADTKKNFPSGIEYSLQRGDMSYAELDKGIIRAVFERKLSGVTYDNMHITSVDTVEVVMTVGASSVLVNEIKRIGVKTECPDCKDLGSEPQPEPEPEPEPGPKPIPPKPDPITPPLVDRRPLLLAWSLGVGAGSSTLGLSDFDVSGFDSDTYTGMNESLSGTEGGAWKNKSAFRLRGGVELIMGRLNNISVGLNIGFIRSSSQLTIDKQEITYKGTADIGEYMRIIQFENVEETVKMSMTNLDFCLGYIIKAGEKISIMPRLGLSFNVASSFKWNGKSTNNIGMSTKIVDRRFTYDENSANGGLEVNNDHFSEQPAMADADIEKAYSDMIDQYGIDLMRPKELSQSGTTDVKVKAGSLIGADLLWATKGSMQFMLGIEYQGRSFTNDNNSAINYSKSTDGYQGFFQTYDSGKITNFTVCVGIRKIISKK